MRKNNKIVSLLLGDKKALQSVRIHLCIPSLCVCLKCRENTKEIGFQNTSELPCVTSCFYFFF